MIDGKVVGELSAASPLGTVTVGGGSGAVSASTAHGDKRDMNTLSFMHGIATYKSRNGREKRYDRKRPHPLVKQFSVTLADDWTRPIKPHLLANVVRYGLDASVEISLLRSSVCVKMLADESMRCTQVIAVLFDEGNSHGRVVIRWCSDKATGEHGLPAKHGHVGHNTGSLMSSRMVGGEDGG